MDFPPKVEIQVKPEFLAEQSDEQQYIFAYHITIINHGDQPIQLMDRYLLITDGNGKKTEVAGSGVVGEQPIISPGGHYSYSSGCSFPTPLGFMEGWYRFVCGEQEWKQPIPLFSLRSQGTLH